MVDETRNTAGRRQVETRENKSQCHRLDGVDRMQGTRTEPLFRRVTALNDLNDTRAERLDRRRVVGEDTHVTSRRREVHLDDIGRGEDGLYPSRSLHRLHEEAAAGTNLVGEDEGQVDLVSGLGVASPAERKVPGCSPSDRGDETKRRHYFCGRAG